MPRKPNPVGRFWAGIDPCRTDGCWIWLGSLTKPGGYPIFAAEGKTQLVHRWAYRQFVGAIPEGYELDHVKARGCQNRSCVCIDHLEPVTTAENARRGSWATKTHCKNGHPFSAENTRYYDGGRYCRQCDADLQRAKREKATNHEGRE